MTPPPDAAARLLAVLDQMLATQDRVYGTAPEGPRPALGWPCPGCRRRPCTGAHVRCDVMRHCQDHGKPKPLP